MSHSLSLLTATLLVAQTPEPSAINSGKTCSCQKNKIQAVQYVQPVPAELAPSSYGAAPRRGIFFRNETASPASTVSDRPILSRIQSIFGRKKEAEFETVAPPVAAPIATEPVREDRNGGVRLMQRLPQSQNQEPAITTPIPANSNVKIVTPATSPAPSHPAATTVTTPGFPVNSSAVQTSPVTQVAGTSSAGKSVPVVSPNGSTVLPPSRPNRISPNLVSKVGHAEDYSWITGQIRIEKGLHVIHYAAPEVIDRFNGSLVVVSERDLRGVSDGAYVCVRGRVETQGGRAMFRAETVDFLPNQ